MIADTPEFAYEKRFSAVDDGAHTWASAPQHIRDIWLAAWECSAETIDEKNKCFFRALLDLLWDVRIQLMVSKTDAETSGEYGDEGSIRDLPRRIDAARAALDHSATTNRVLLVMMKKK
jgi:hypothetical protein